MIWFTAMQNFVFAATTCQWYFYGYGSDAQDDATQQSVSVCSSVWWSFRYHCGSIAFGSALITICTIIKFVFEYFAAKLSQITGDNCAVQCVLCIARCCINCVDCCIRYMTDNAIIQTALRSTNFCTSMVESFWMMVRNPGAFSVLNYISWMLMLLGKGSIVATSGYVTYLLCQYALPEVQNPLVPAIFIGIWAYLVSSLYLGIFEFSSMAILQCFIFNEEIGGKDYTPDALRPFIQQLDEDEHKADPDNYQLKYAKHYPK